MTHPTDTPTLPREKFAAQGAAACTNADLLAILIGTGTADEDVHTLAQHILDDCCGSLASLHSLTLGQLMEYRGVGQAKALIIKAAAELAQRRLDEATATPTRIDCPARLFEYFERTLHLSELTHEEMHALYLNSQLKPVAHMLVGRGGLTHVDADIRLILRGALMHRATHIAICHNHPSHSVRPSAPDDRLTHQLRQACDTMNLILDDHLIIADSRNYYSYSAENRLSR